MGSQKESHCYCLSFEAKILLDKMCFKLFDSPSVWDWGWSILIIRKSKCKSAQLLKFEKYFYLNWLMVTRYPVSL